MNLTFLQTLSNNFGNRRGEQAQLEWNQMSPADVSDGIASAYRKKWKTFICHFRINN